MALRMSAMLRSSRDLRGGRARTLTLKVPPAPRSDPDEPMMAAVAQAQELAPLQDIVDAPEMTETDGAVIAYESLVEAAYELFAAAAESRAPNGPVVVAAVRSSVSQLSASDALLTETMRRRPEADSLARHSANVAVMAMRLGREIEFDERRTFALGLCGLTHDLGMLDVPDEILEFARIVGLVDTYEAMAQPPADRQARVVHNALKEIIDLRNSLFGRRLIKALIHIVSIFPLGSLVKLNNGEIGRVVATSRLHPTRPTIDLQDEPILYIVDPAIEEGVLGNT